MEERQPRQAGRIHERLDQLVGQEPFPGADAPDPKAFDDARAFAKQLPPSLTETPHISLADDGELNFSWTGPRITVDLGFYGTGTYSYFARDSQGHEYRGDDVPAAGPMPEHLKGALTKQDRPDPPQHAHTP